MNTKHMRSLGKLSMVVGLPAFLFLLFEFTDKNSCTLVIFSDAWESLLSHLKIPNCIEVWASGKLTVAGLVVILVFLLAFYIFCKQLVMWIRTASYQNRRGHYLKLLGSIMFLLWSIGWGLFLQAFLYFPEEHMFVNSELLFRSAIASLDMFMLDIDSNVLDKIEGNAHLKGTISFVCVLSFACTVALLISLVSARIWAYFRLRYCSRIIKNHSHIYIFFGLERKMELLAKNIATEDKKSLRIFIEKTKSEEDDNKEGWDHLLAMLTHRREAFKKVKDLDARLALTNSSICSLEISCDEFDVLGEAELDNIKKLIAALKSYSEDAELHLFFLSENEDNNIESVNVIKKDVTINDVANNGVKVVVYCHARRNSVIRVIEHTSLDKKIEVRIIDSAHLAVEELKTKDNIDLQPVSFVDIKEDATTSSKFNALVIGFNEVGQDIVRFLYEYGAFVNSDRTNGVRRSPFQCHVVDSNMEDIAPHYMDTHMRMGGGQRLVKSCH